MATTDNIVFKFLRIVAWIIFVGLSIEAGALIVNFFFTIYNPEFVPNLYQKLDLIQMYNTSKSAFFGLYSFIMFLSVLKAFLFYIVVVLLTKMDLSKPFSTFVSEKISQISYYTFSIGLLSYIARQTARDLEYYNYSTVNLDEFWGDSQAFLLMSAVIYMIASIFKKGVDIQNENDLTV